MKNYKINELRNATCLPFSSSIVRVLYIKIVQDASVRRCTVCACILLYLLASCSRKKSERRDQWDFGAGMYGYIYTIENWLQFVFPSTVCLYGETNIIIKNKEKGLAKFTTVRLIFLTMFLVMARKGGRRGFFLTAVETLPHGTHFFFFFFNSGIQKSDPPVGI